MKFFARLSAHKEYDNFWPDEILSLSTLVGAVPSRRDGAPTGSDSQGLSASGRPQPPTDPLNSLAAVAAHNAYSFFDFTDAKTASRFFQRSILIRFICQVWGYGETWEQAKQMVAENKLAEENGQTSLGIKNALEKGRTFAVKVDTFGRKLSDKESKARIAEIGFLFDGIKQEDMPRVDLKNPDTYIVVGELWDEAAHKQNRASRYFVGKAVGHHFQKQPSRVKYDLIDRPILGPTSLNNDLSFLMANQALVKTGSTVLDPFCGTGGLLIACAHLGALCFGSDIDVRVLKGWSVAYNNPLISRTRIEEDRKEKQDLHRKKMMEGPDGLAALAANDRNDGNEDDEDFKQNLNSRGKKRGVVKRRRVKLPPYAAPSAKSRDVFYNFEQYGLPRPEIIAADNAAPAWRHCRLPGKLLSSSSQNHCEVTDIDGQQRTDGNDARMPCGSAIGSRKSEAGWVDAIVTDPPYGIRARSRQAAFKQRAVKSDCPDGGETAEFSTDSPATTRDDESAEAERRRLHFPQTVVYRLEGVIRDLLDFGSDLLVDNGRLVFLLPVSLEGCEEQAATIRQHPDFEMIGATLQVLNKKRGRVLITLVRKNRAST